MSYTQDWFAALQDHFLHRSAYDPLDVGVGGTLEPIPMSKVLDVEIMAHAA